MSEAMQNPLEWIDRTAFDPNLPEDKFVIKRNSPHYTPIHRISSQEYMEHHRALRESYLYTSPPDHDDIGKVVIMAEKLLCKTLDREWSPVSMSVASLVQDLASRSSPTVTRDWIEELNQDLVVEAERAMAQRDKFKETRESTAAHGGSHDTCFTHILTRHLKKLGIQVPSGN